MKSLGSSQQIGHLGQIDHDQVGVVDRASGIDQRQLIFQRTAGDNGNGIPRRVQAEVQTRAGALGVPVARVIATTVAEDDLGDGAVTELVAGEALAPRWLRLWWGMM